MITLIYSTDPLVPLAMKQIIPEGDIWSTTTTAALTREAFRADMVIVFVDPAITLDVMRGVESMLRPHEGKLVLVGHNIPAELMAQAIALKIAGIIDRYDSEFLIRAALERIVRGELSFAPDLVRGFLSQRKVALTPRESQLVQLVTRGLPNKEIGFRLNIGEGTVKVYLSRLFRKTRCKSRYELAAFGRANLTGGTLMPREAPALPRLTTLYLPPAA